jgi:hypothetical protein
MALISAQSRLAANHPIIPVLASNQYSLEAGIGGEQQVAEVFQRYHFPFKNNIFHDLSLSSDSNFQIDHLFKTPYYGVILETKNMSGSLTFKENPQQLIQKKDDGELKYYESPVVQLERNMDLLSAWFSKRNIHLPLHGAIVLAYPKQIVEIPPANTTILFPNMIPPFIKGLPQDGAKLSHQTFNGLAAELLKSHHPYIPNPVCETYKIPFGDIKPGVKCCNCGKIGMKKLPRTWHCSHCGLNDHLAHVKTLKEWFLVVKRSITNRECREFLGVDVHTATRILQSMNMNTRGTYRNKSYIMDLSKLLKK